jgi:hypothetical protein
MLRTGRVVVRRTTREHQRGAVDADPDPAAGEDLRGEDHPAGPFDGDRLAGGLRRGLHEPPDQALSLAKLRLSGRRDA